MKIMMNEHNELKHMTSILTEEEKKKFLQEQKEIDDNTLEYITE
jgi:hypothetical protein